jgi:hypothetical protein
MQACHITSCHVTFLHWKIILKIIVYNASHLSNHPAHSNQLSHLPHLDASSPPNSWSHATASPTRIPSTKLCLLPLLFRNVSPVTSSPLRHFSSRFPVNFDADVLKIHHLRQAHPFPTPFLSAHPAYKRHRESCRPLPHSFLHVLPMKTATCRRSSPPPNRFRYSTTSCHRWWALQNLPLSHGSVTTSYPSPQRPPVELRQAAPLSMDARSTVDQHTSSPFRSTTFPIEK